MYVQLANLYNKNHGLMGDQLIASQHWCQKKWEHLLSPIESCDQAIIRLAAALFLSVATVGAYVLAMVGVACKAISFTWSGFWTEVDARSYSHIFGNAPIVIRASVENAGALFEQHLNDKLTPHIEQIFAEYWLPVLQFAVARTEGQHYRICCAIQPWPTKHTDFFHCVGRPDANGNVVFEISEQDVVNMVLIASGRGTIFPVVRVMVLGSEPKVI